MWNYEKNKLIMKLKTTLRKKCENSGLDGVFEIKIKN